VDAPLYPLVALVARAVARLFRLEHTGRLPAGGCVVVCGHFSYLDPFFLVAAAGPRRLRFLGTYSHFGLPVAHLYPLVGAFPVHRGKGDQEALRKAANLARAGEAVVIFPEGTRRRKGNLLKRLVGRPYLEPRPRRGAARVARLAGVPLVPVGLQGADRLWRRRLRVLVGAPWGPGSNGPAELSLKIWKRVQALEQP